MKSFSIGPWTITIQRTEDLPRIFPAIAGAHIPAGSLVTTSWKRTDPEEAKALVGEALPAVKEEPNAPRALKNVRYMAFEHGWRELWHKPEEKRVRFKKGPDTYIDVWYTKMTVGTILSHPKQGRTQLFRKNVSDQALMNIFRNPRSHTGEGYYQQR